MNPPQVYMCSPSWTLLPPPSPFHLLWTLWERERAGRFGRMALKHVKYHVWNELPVQVWCTILDARGWCTVLSFLGGKMSLLSHCFWGFFFDFNFETFATICLGVDCFRLILFGICLGSFIYRLMGFAKFVNFSFIISLSTFSTLP